MSTKAKPKYYGEEAQGGGYECVCRKCNCTFLCLSPVGCYCPACRKPLIDDLPMREKNDQVAILDCSKGCGRWVPHGLSRYENVEVHGVIDVVLIYYACQKCGAERVYGTIDPGATR